MKKLLFLALGFAIMCKCYAEEKIVLIADPAVLAIPIHENHEPMIDLIHQNEISYGPPPLLPNNTNYTKVRIH